MAVHMTLSIVGDEKPGAERLVSLIRQAVAEYGNISLENTKRAGTIDVFNAVIEPAGKVIVGSPSEGAGVITDIEFRT